MTSRWLLGLGVLVDYVLEASPSFDFAPREDNKLQESRQSKKAQPRVYIRPRWLYELALELRVAVRFAIENAILESRLDAVRQCYIGTAHQAKELRVGEVPGTNQAPAQASAIVREATPAQAHFFHLGHSALCKEEWPSFATVPVVLPLVYDEAVYDEAVRFIHGVELFIGLVHHLLLQNRLILHIVEVLNEACGV
jgi:hypothetical protein